jgi:hypothetical protein
MMRRSSRSQHQVRNEPVLLVVDDHGVVLFFSLVCVEQFPYFGWITWSIFIYTMAPVVAMESQLANVVSVVTVPVGPVKAEPAESRGDFLEAVSPERSLPVEEPYSEPEGEEPEEEEPEEEEEEDARTEGSVPEEEEEEDEGEDEEEEMEEGRAVLVSWDDALMCGPF